jgi:hypothetical protein
LFEDLAECLVGFLGFQFDDLQFLDDLRDGPVGFGVAGVDGAAGGDVVVVFLQLGVIDDAAEFFLLLPPDEGVGDALDAGVGDEVLGIALFEDLAGVAEEDLTLSGLGLIPVEEEDDAGGDGVLEEVLIRTAALTLQAALAGSLGRSAPFGASLAPGMEQAASQIKDSRDLSFSTASGGLFPVDFFKVAATMDFFGVLSI